MSEPFLPTMPSEPRRENDDLITVMEDETRVKGFLDLYKQQMQQRHNTAGIEWKANIGYWTLLAGANYFVAQHPIAVPISWAVPICVLTIVMHLWWLVMIHLSEQSDKKLLVYYRIEAARRLRGDAGAAARGANLSPPDDEVRSNKNLFRYACWLIPELWPTFALSVLLLWFLMTAGGEHPSLGL